MGRSHNAAFFYSVIEQCKGSGGTVAAAHFQTHFFQNVCDRVTDSRCRCKRQVDDSKRNAQFFTGFLADQLTHTGDLESRPFDQIGNFCQICVFREFCQCCAYNARTGNADIDFTVRFADTMESACHKGVVLNRIAENNQFCCTDAVAVSGQFSGSSDDTAHHFDRVHIDTSLGRTDVDRRTEVVSNCQRLGNRLDQRTVTGCKAFLYQRGIAADKVDAAGIGAFFQSQRIFDRVTARSGQRYSNRRD